MNDLQHEFIRQSVADLDSIAEKSRRYKNAILPDNLLSEVFRALHTVKGTSQVFGLLVPAGFAHALENVIIAGKNGMLAGEDLKILLPEGLNILAQSLAKKDFQIPASFSEKIQNHLSDFGAANSPNNRLSEIPEEFPASLSAQEKSLLGAALKNGKNACIIEIGFEAANFADEFKNFRAALSEKGEVIAVLPSAKFVAQNKIGFQIVYANGETVESVVKDWAAEIIHQTRSPDFNNLSDIVRQIAAHGKMLAQRFDKNVDFELIVEVESLPAPILKIVFDALAHLVRNAVSHAFDRRGKITIEAKTAPNGLVLKVSDDGKGLDAEKIRRAAIEKNLISIDDILSANEITDLIFAPNFSTAEQISDVSGRGVGLDAVKAATENADGKISVRSEAGAGTTFEIFLPVDFEKMRRRGDAETENGGD